MVVSLPLLPDSAPFAPEHIEALNAVMARTNARSLRVDAFSVVSTSKLRTNSRSILIWPTGALRSTASEE